MRENKEKKNKKKYYYEYVEKQTTSQKTIIIIINNNKPYSPFSIDKNFYSLIQTQTQTHIFIDDFVVRFALRSRVVFCLLFCFCVFSLVRIYC